jgi:hypothetical protein
MQVRPYPSMLADPYYEGNTGRTGSLEHVGSHPAENAGCPKQGVIPAWVRNFRSTQGGPVMGSADRTTGSRVAIRARG